ncbi:hypothetical protein D3C72_2456170 [compost metagenome]
MVRFCSSIILRVITVTDCGVSRSECSPFAKLTCRTVRLSVVSMPVLRVLAPMVVAPSSSAPLLAGSGRIE